MPELRIGAPGLSATDATEDLRQLTLGQRDFPLRVRALNLFPFPARFPRSGRFYLRPSGHAGSEGEHVFDSLEALQRFVADVQAVASMRKAALGIVLRWPAPGLSTPAKPTAAATAPVKSEAKPRARRRSRSSKSDA